MVLSSPGPEHDGFALQITHHRTKVMQDTAGCTAHLTAHRVGHYMVLYVIRDGFESKYCVDEENLSRPPPHRTQNHHSLRSHLRVLLIRGRQLCNTVPGKRTDFLHS